MGKWVFEELRGAAVRRQPNEAELFKAEQSEEGEYAGTDALVREILQNAIDARAGDERIRVRLAIHEASEAPSSDRLAHYFARLKEPLQAKQIEYRDISVPKLPCRFLVCEDFGTRGLEGNTDLFADPTNGSQGRQDFFWFWRNIGRSAKTGDDLGRWGLGKTVYRAVSRTSCMFGLTVRASDRSRLLMGQAVLPIHPHGGKEFQPEGYWCGSENGKGLPMPIVDATDLDQFSIEWKLSRTDEPGLSVVAPYIGDELQAKRLAEAVVIHFFTRIVRSEMEVEIVGDNFHAVLNEQTIDKVCPGISDWKGPRKTKRNAAPPVEFLRRCLKTHMNSTHVLGSTRVPTWGDPVFMDDVLKDLQQRYAQRELLGVRVLLALPRKQGAAAEGHADVFLQRGDPTVRHDSYFVREGMTITKIDSRVGKQGVRAMVIVDKGPLAELLGDTEGPAHEDWNTSAERPDKTWKVWKGRVNFVRGMIDGLNDLLTPKTSVPDVGALSDMFSIPKPPPPPGPTKSPGPGPDEPGEPTFPPIPVVPKWYYVHSHIGGIRIGRNKAVDMPTGMGLKVSLAYDIPRGNPLRNWSPHDFLISVDNSGLKPELQGLRAFSQQGNVVLLQDFAPEFSFTVDGFDEYRDVFVRVDEVSLNEEVSDD